MKLLAIIILALVFVAGCAVQEPVEEDMELPPAPNITEEQQAFEDEMKDLQEDLEEVDELDEVEVDDYTELQQKPETKPTTPLSYKLNIPKVTVTCDEGPCLDDLGSYAMAARYFNKGIDLISVVGYGSAGCDAKVWSNTDIDNKYGETAIIIASENYGYDFDLGVGVKGVASRSKYDLKFEDNADNVMFFNNGEHALQILKEGISSEYPTIVYLDVSYLEGKFAEQSDFWKILAEEKQGNFVVVTGYDKDYIYISHPNDKESENMAIGKANFVLAWETTKFLSDKNLGPFWMLQLKKGSLMKHDAELLIEENNKASEKAVDELEKFSTVGGRSDEVCMQLSSLSRTRTLYADFLKRYEFNLASTMYEESADFLAYACEDGIRDGLKGASTKEYNAHKAIN